MVGCGLGRDVNLDNFIPKEPVSEQQRIEAENEAVRTQILTFFANRRATRKDNE